MHQICWLVTFTLHTDWKRQRPILHARDADFISMNHHSQDNLWDPKDNNGPCMKHLQVYRSMSYLLLMMLPCLDLHGLLEDPQWGNGAQGQRVDWREGNGARLKQRRVHAQAQQLEPPVKSMQEAYWCEDWKLQGLLSAMRSGNFLWRHDWRTGLDQTCVMDQKHLKWCLGVGEGMITNCLFRVMTAWIGFLMLRRSSVHLVFYYPS